MAQDATDDLPTFDPVERAREILEASRLLRESLITTNPEAKNAHRSLVDEGMTRDAASSRIWFVWKMAEYAAATGLAEPETVAEEVFYPALERMLAGDPLPKIFADLWGRLFNDGQHQPV